MKPVLIKFLGHFELPASAGGRDLPGGAKPILLLAHLALSPGQVHDRKRLAAQFWPDRAEAQALASLRQALWSLRRALGDAQDSPLLAGRTSISLNQAAIVVDAAAFQHLIRRGGREDLEAAVQLYRGDLLAEFDLDDIEGLAPLQFERRRLKEMALSALKSLAGLRAKAGELDGAIDMARRALAQDPLQEDVHATLIRLYRDQGRPGLALDQYETCRNLLRQDLDVDPSTEIETLRQSIGVRPSPDGAAAKDPRPWPATTDKAPQKSAQSPAPQGWGVYALALASGALVLVLLLLFLVPSQLRGPALAAPGRVAGTHPSLVVLPFEDISVDHQQAEFASGLTDDLITDLSKLSDLVVLAPETSRSLTDPALSARELAGTLGVNYVLTGTVRRSRGMIRVTAELVAAGTGVAVWAERYDRQDAELFTMQDEIVQRIVTSLHVRLTDRERRTLARVPTRNLEAYDLYLRAEYQTAGLTEAEVLVRSVAAYRRAIALDPDFAEAHAGLARAATTIWRADYSEIMSSAMARDEAYTAAGKALELDPENARGYEVLSVIQLVEGATPIAVDSARKAVALQPGDAEAHTNMAHVLFAAGDLDAAQEEIVLARRLNPALSAELRLVSASVAFAEKRYADAVAEFTELGASVPRNELVLEHLAAAHAYLGDLASARAVVEELRAILPITNLNYYTVLGRGVGTAEQGAHFIEGLRRAGIPEWPYGDQRSAADRLGGADLRALVSERTWEGVLNNGVHFIQYFDAEGRFAYRSPSSLLSGRVTVEGDRLCQVIEGYLLDRPTCGYVYAEATDATHPGPAYAYVSIDALKNFSVTP